VRFEAEKQTPRVRAQCSAAEYAGEVSTDRFWGIEDARVLSCLVDSSTFPRSCRPHTAARAPLPSIAVYASRASDKALSTHVRATYATRGPRYRVRSCATRVCLFLRGDSHARETPTALKAGSARRRDGDLGGPPILSKVRRGTKTSGPVAFRGTRASSPIAYLRTRKPRLPRY